MTDMANMTPAETKAAEKERQRLLKYYSASQWTLIWWRVKRHRAAMVASFLLGLMALAGIFAEFVAHECVGGLNQDAGTVTRQRVGPNSAPVGQILKDLKPLRNNIV